MCGCYTVYRIYDLYIVLLLCGFRTGRTSTITFYGVW